jgi:hypothetical protein
MIPQAVDHARAECAHEHGVLLAISAKDGQTERGVAVPEQKRRQSELLIGS